MKLSLCITTYNRPELTVESFEKVVQHPSVGEIVIMDDCSELGNFSLLRQLTFDNEIIRLWRNIENLGMMRNKAEAINCAQYPWAILFDSDNILYPEYLDSIKNYDLDPEVIYCPEFAEPNFDFRELSGVTINKENAPRYMRNRMFRVFLNCCNYVVNRERYLEVFKFDPTVKESDTIHFNYLWLKAGYSFYFVPGMKYFHRVHEESGWLKNQKENSRKAEEIQKLICQL